MEVVLEKIPQEGYVGPMQVIHWAIRVGKGPASVCYEFESDGVQMGPKTTCDHGYEIERQRLGVTHKTHEQIQEWAFRFGELHEYRVAGCDLGGRNCQDFATELCCFLGVGTSQLPWRQARQVEAAVGGSLAAAGALAVGCALFSALVGTSSARSEAEPEAQGRRRRSKVCCP
uniref:PPPDE domain-containing protein n=1 Tax=Pyrodinium bahamense TaxID=73915 RepID=A0A7S0FK21_9DINO